MFSANNIKQIAGDFKFEFKVIKIGRKIDQAKLKSGHLTINQRDSSPGYLFFLRKKLLNPIYLHVEKLTLTILQTLSI